MAARLVDRGMQATERVRSGISDIQRLLGTVKEWDAPNKEQFSRAVVQRLDELAALVERVPLEHAHTLAALERVVRRLPPTVGQKEEFRDQLVWQAVLLVASRGDRVVFVSADSGFYEQGSPTKGLARALLADIATLDVSVVPDLAGCLELVGAAAPPIARDALVQALATTARPEVEQVAQRLGYQVADLQSADLTAYATERPTIVAVVFRLSWVVAGEPTDGVARLQPIAVAEGTAFYDPSTQALDEMRPDRYAIEWTNEEGEGQQTGTVMLGVASITLGSRSIEWTVRHELDEPR